MFFITTNTNISVEPLFERIFKFVYPDEKKKNTITIQNNNLNAVFYDCQKVELKSHTVIISGNAFPKKNETLKSSLQKVIQNKKEEDLNGNFNLIVFNKNPGKNNVFSIVGDRHGTIPCFFSLKNNEITISSVIQLLLLDRTNHKFNEESLLDYLCLGHTFPEKSLWNEIEILPKEKSLTVFPHKNHLVLKNKINNITQSTSFKSLKECATVFFETLKEVINDENKFLNVSAMLLTGGSDTRMLLSCMKEKQRNKLLYKTFSASDTQSDLLIAKMIAKTFNLNHHHYSRPGEEKLIVKFPQSSKITQYKAFNNKIQWIGGQFGTELFGGGALNGFLGLDYCFSEIPNFLKDRLLNSLITFQTYKKIGSPWNRLNEKILLTDSINKEGAFMQQVLLRSQFTSIYSRTSTSTFIIPSEHHFIGVVLPFIDTRMIDFFLRCPREFLLNYSLYEYVFMHFSEKKLVEIPFHSNMMNFVESLPKMEKDKTALKSKKVDCAPKVCDYVEYFKNHFHPLLFERTFLNGLSHTDGQKIPEPFLSRICDLNCFLLGLRNKEPF